MRERTRYLLTISLLASLAVAQPLFALLGEQAEFFVAQGWGRPRILAFAVTVGVLGPLLLGAVPAAVASINGRAGAWVFGFLLVLLSALVALPFAGLDGFAALLAAAAAGVATGLAWRFLRAIRLFFVALSPAVLVFPLVFLLSSRAASIGDDGGDAIGDAVSFDQTPDIVMLVLDEFPLASILDGDLDIDADQFPNFARLAATAHWYPQATTGADRTVGAVPEALTGRALPAGAPPLPIVAEHPRNLFTLLSGHYRIDATETATALCPETACPVLNTSDKRESVRQPLRDIAIVYAHIVTPEPWSSRLPSISGGWTGFGRDRAVDDDGLASAKAKARLSSQTDWSRRAADFDAFVRRIEPGDTPQLWYLHTLLPHAVWRYLPDGRQYLVEERWEGLEHLELDGRTVDVWQDDEWAVRQFQQRHLLQVQFVDTLLGRLLGRLDATGAADDTLLVVMGDHGVSFHPGEPRRAVTPATRTDIAAVPLFIRRPGQDAGVRGDMPARLVDVLPTIADALGTTPRGTFDGVALFSDGAGAGRATVRIVDKDGQPTEYPLSAHMSELAASASARREAFGNGLFAPQATPGLGGLGDALNGATADGEVVLDAPWLYRKVDTDTGFVPIRVTGRLEGAEGDTTLAVAVNGHMTAVTRTWRLPGLEGRFSAMLPPGALVDGANELTFYRVDEDGALARFDTSTADSVSWSAVAGDTFIEHGGERTPVTVTGDGHAFTEAGEGGSLINVYGSTPAPRVVVFVDDHYVGEAVRDGRLFALPVPIDDDQPARRARLRVVAMTPDRAWELAYPEPCAPNWDFAPPPSWRGVDCDPRAALVWNDTAAGRSARLDFSRPEARLALGAGWSLDGSGVGWTTGPRTVVTLPLGDVDGRLRFRALVKPFIAPPELRAQNVWLLIDGEEAGAWRLDSPDFEELQWEFPVAAGEHDELELTWLLPDAVSPASLGEGEDLRALGLAFQWLEVRAGNADDDRGEDR